MQKEVRISDVQPDGQAARLGLKKGDIVVSFNGQAISSNEVLTGCLSRAQGIENVLEIKRDWTVDKYSVSGQELGVQVEEVDKNLNQHTDQTEDIVAKAIKGSDYGIARAVSYVIAMIGWIVVGISALFGLFTFFEDGWSNAVSLFGSTIPGFFMIMGAQVTRAVVDTADYNRQLLKLLHQERMSSQK